MTIETTLSGSEVEYIDRCIAQIAQGDRDALTGLYEKTHVAINGFALFLLKNRQDAEDVLQDTYVQVFLSAEQYRSQGKPMAWLMTIARNQAMMRLRNKGRTVTMSPEDWNEQFADKSTVTNEDMLTLHALLDLLTDEERQIVSLHALTGLKYREIAAMLDMPLPTVLSKYHRAIKKLGNSLKEAQ